LVLIGLINF